MSATRDSGPWIGRRLPRREDRRFITGRGEYVDDRRFSDVVYVFPVSSVYAHAKIVRIDASEALRVPGVLGVLTADDLLPEIKPMKAAIPSPNSKITSFPLARDKVRYFGEPVVVVVADSPEAAEDACLLVDIEYEPLEPVLDPEKAIAPNSPIVHENVATNLAWRRVFSYGDVAGAFAEADRVVKRRLHLHRFTSAPLETRQAVVSYNPRTGVFDIFSNIQSPERHRSRIASSLGVSPDKIHLECPDIGGGFGIKGHVLWTLLLCTVARRYGRPAKWVEDRFGHLSASHHGNEVLYDAELAVRTDGTILGLRTRAIHDEGAYLDREPKGTVNQLRHATLTYTFRNIEMDFLAVMTNKCPTGPNRAYGKVQQVFLVERLIDEAARELNLDPVDMRRRNLVQPDQMPYETPTGALYDGGDYPELLSRVCAMYDFADFRRRQADALKDNRYLGVGIAVGIEASPSNGSLHQLIDPAEHRSGDSEAALVRIGMDGHVFAAVGSVAQGQGHETTVSQIVADALAVEPDQVDATIGFDSLRDPSTPYSGTHASRFAVTGGGAMLGACNELRKKITSLAAHLLNVPAGDVLLSAGSVYARSGGASISFAQLARIANLDLARLPEGMQPGLEARYVYQAPFGQPKDAVRGNFSLTYAYGASLVEVAVDIETGRIRPERIVSVHDCGVQLNPLIVEGQVHGAIAHQLGAALFERIEYDEQGRLMTSTFKNYLTLTAADLPNFECDHIETPSLFSSLGVRGGGEGSGTPLVAAINAVADALAPLGVELVEGHVSPSDVWTLVQSAQSRQPAHV
jgi:CO/xanthine dehydrogenase Mo-binding subunit